MAQDDNEAQDDSNPVVDNDNAPQFPQCTDPLYPQAVLNSDCNQIGILNENTFTIEYSLENSSWYPKPTYKGLKMLCFDYESSPDIDEATKQGIREKTVIFSNNPAYGVGFKTIGYGHNPLTNEPLYKGDVSIEAVYPEGKAWVHVQSWSPQKSDSYVKPAGAIFKSDPFNSIDYSGENIFILCSVAGISPLKWVEDPYEGTILDVSTVYLGHMVLMSGSQYMGYESLMKE
ncbi:MAG: hypothetical protein N3H30_02010 [Candidatus Micrarchaeota archaeon]|nr:hypothetical protein [Candidatus Micrarchaeota archaeon]